MRILFVAPYVLSAIRVRPYNFLRALARRGHTITLVCSRGEEDDAALAELGSLCERVIGVRLSGRDMLRNALAALPGGLPLQAALNRDPRLLSAVAAEARRGYDVAHIEHLRGSALADALGQTPVLLDAVDSISLLFERTLRSGPSAKSRAMAWVDLERTRRYEAAYTTRYGRVVVSSPEDAAALVELQRRYGHPEAPAPVVVANGVDLAYFAPLDLARPPATVVFSGKMGYHANEAAALFLVQEIMPLVWAQRPEVRVTIAGSSPPASVVALGRDPRVAVTGFLPDLRPAIAGATLAVCPLRYGVGIQTKVLEAMALATPVVAARQAARALAAVEGRDLLLAEHAGEYAEAIVRLLADPALAAQMGAAGRRYVEACHDWDKAAQTLERLYQEIALTPAGAHEALEM